MITDLTRTITCPNRHLQMREQWDARRLRQTLGRFATGVTIVTTRTADGACIGLTANSFNSVSLDPALVLWSLGKKQGSSVAFRECSHFAINILSSSQIELSRRFASPVEDRFAGVDFSCGAFGAPLIDGCAAWLVCSNHQQYELGDHLLFIGEVQALGSGEEKPLVFHDGDYALTHSFAASTANA